MGEIQNSVLSMMNSAAVAIGGAKYLKEKTVQNEEAKKRNFMDAENNYIEKTNALAASDEEVNKSIADSEKQYDVLLNSRVGRKKIKNMDPSYLEGLDYKWDNGGDPERKLLGAAFPEYANYRMSEEAIQRAVNINNIRISQKQMAEETYRKVGGKI